ncbi:tRNA pseudouridine synthase 10 [Nematocida ausubeli]|nr:tRNA pseudouridine synthase 10 [Nematocida ausubeli]
MKRKIPEEILNEIITAITDASKIKETFDNLQISIQDTAETEVSSTQTLKEYLKENLVAKYGRHTSSEFGTMAEIVIKKETVSVKLVNDSIYVSGRYRKNKRGISNTPMVFGEGLPSRRKRKKMEKAAAELNGLQVIQVINAEETEKQSVYMDANRDKTSTAQNAVSASAEQPEERMPAVSDWIDPLKEYFGSNKAIFISGGREDYDVRMLGNGRPFICRIENPSRNLPRKVGALCTVMTESGKEAEEYTVEYKPHNIKYKMSRDVEILETRLVEGAASMKDLKAIEEVHCKVYGVRVRCLAPQAMVISQLLSTYWKEDATIVKNVGRREFVLKDTCLKLSQRTPIRVLQRRANMVRDKVIHKCRVSIESAQDEDTTVISIELKASSGTYIKEFINGDMGRTTPSLSEVVGEYCAVLELDVLSIEDTFPSKEYVLGEVNLV